MTPSQEALDTTKAARIEALNKAHKSMDATRAAELTAKEAKKQLEVERTNAARRQMVTPPAHQTGTATP